MNHKKNSGNKSIRQMLLRLWPLYVIALIVAVGGALAFSHLYGEDDTPKYELARQGGEIDFTAHEIPAHNAEAGIAVVKPTPAPEGESARPARTVADPTEIWQGAIAPTHSGYTLPVAMEDGDSIGVLTIPDIGLSVRVYESENDMEDMERGVAHFKTTSAFEGNIGLSAHNVNFSGTAGYFYNLHKLTPGAVIQYETALGSREYVVDSIAEIDETDWTPLERTEDNRITLITCITGKPSMRLCVQGIERHP